MTLLQSIPAATKTKSNHKMSSIVVESSDYLQVFSDGSIKRSAPPIADASLEYNGYRSKDVIIDPFKPISARIFLPDTPGCSTVKLPVLVYFHGGGFCIGSTTWLGYHHFLGDLSVSAQCIVVSVDFRLAPEYRLPIAYDDCFSSLGWLETNLDSEPWLKQADLDHVFLSGDSAGGNIAHHVGLKALRNEANHVKIMGLLPIHPYFGSEKRTEQEMGDGATADVTSNDMYWRLSLPEGSTRDHSACNFEMSEVLEVEWKQFPKVVVYVAGLDFLKERGVMYAEFLKKKGVDVKLVEEEDESHVYHVFHPLSEATRLLQHQMSEFMNLP